MDKREFLQARKKLAKTQRQMAGLLGTSLKAVQSYEQGWRSIPTHAERQIYFLLSMLRENKRKQKPCWVIRKCSSDRRIKCAAWEFKAGGICWFVNGTMCEGKVQKDWHEKMKICRSCQVIASLL